MIIFLVEDLCLENSLLLCFTLLCFGRVVCQCNTHFEGYVTFSYDFKVIKIECTGVSGLISICNVEEVSGCYSIYLVNSFNIPLTATEFETVDPIF